MSNSHSFLCRSGWCFNWMTTSTFRPLTPSNFPCFITLKTINYCRLYLSSTPARIHLQTMIADSIVHNYSNPLMWYKCDEITWRPDHSKWVWKQLNLATSKTSSIQLRTPNTSFYCFWLNNRDVESMTKPNVLYTLHLSPPPSSVFPPSPPPIHHQPKKNRPLMFINACKISPSLFR